MADLKTLNEIARQLGERPHRVAYVVSSYGIEPTARVANVRLFDGPTVTQIQSYLRRTAASVNR